jgi:dephospho-CoA kinase
MRVFGLTGGIASGKSTVAQLFRTLDVAVVDADLIARELVMPGQPALAEIFATFGDSVRAANGSLDRAKLGELVFGDATKRAVLNAILHPKIAERSALGIQKLAASGHKAAIYEAALIVENGLHKALAGLIVVSASPEHQLRRLMQRDGLTENDARARMAAQAPLAEKLAAATWVINNDGTKAETEAQVKQIHTQLEQQR